MLKKSSVALALSLALSGYASAAEAPIVDSKTDLGTLRPGNGGYSYASGVSADGKVVVGYAYFENAFVWREGDTKMTGLGTLKADNSGYSNASGVSADGTVVVGESRTDSGD
ncbi:hypothetical protein KIU32_004467, partial [Escherichia coli]|nr:hypothetical protein [Escherichia coli]